jgi:hypothetical protein
LHRHVPRQRAAFVGLLLRRLVGIQSRAKHLCDFVVSLGGGVLERIDLITLRRQSQIGAGGDQDQHGVCVAARSIAQDDRLVQRGPTQVIDVVDLDVGLCQAARDVGVTAVRRTDQPGAVERVLGVDVRAVSALGSAAPGSPRWWR